MWLRVRVFCSALVVFIFIPQHTVICVLYLNGSARLILHHGVRLALGFVQLGKGACVHHAAQARRGIAGLLEQQPEWR